MGQRGWIGWIRGAATAAIAAASLAAAGAAQAQGAAANEDQGWVKYRQNLMRAIGGDMGAIADMLKYGLPLSERLTVHAVSLKQHAALVPGAFERKANGAPNDSMPAIWEKQDEFLQDSREFEAAAAKLADAATTGDPKIIAAELKAVGKTCGGCHESFRKPKEESYLRKGGAD